MSTRARLVWIACLMLCLPALLAHSNVPLLQEKGPVRTYAVSGRVVHEDGRPARDVTVMIGREQDEGFTAESCDVGQDGVFRSRRLAPGLYVVDASVPSTDSATAGGGYAVVVVRDADITDVSIILHPPAVAAGHVKFESERGVDAPRPTVVVNAFLVVERMRMNHSTVAPVAVDGTFTLRDLHGPRLIRVGYFGASNTSPWWLKAVLLDGVNITNVPIDFLAKPSARLEVVFSDRPTAVVGVVHDEAGLPVEGARVVLFSKDASMWAAWSTSVQTGISDENGRFWFVDAMPPGDYRAIALRDNPPSTVAEAVDDLPRLEKFATPIPVGESKVSRVELIISRNR